jgi:hypothetical protein
VWIAAAVVWHLLTSPDVCWHRLGQRARLVVDFRKKNFPDKSRFTLAVYITVDLSNQ